MRRRTVHIRSARGGFTLVELMIVLVIVAILAAIAYPAYTQHVLKTHRRAATACLMELAQWMERFYTTNMRYDQDTNGSAVTLPTLTCRNDLSARFSFAFDSGQPTATTYTIVATAQGAQANDKESGTACSPLTINQAGARTPAACW
jgi:type IV pilus assembly protein PilE